MTRLDEIRERRAAIGPDHWYWWMSGGPPFAIGAGSNVGIGVTTSSGPQAEFVASAPADIDYLLSLLSGQAARDRETRFAAGSLSGAPNADSVTDSAGGQEQGVGSGPSAPSVNDVRLEMLREVMAALGWDDYARPQTPESLWRECLAAIRDQRRGVGSGPSCAECGEPKASWKHQEYDMETNRPDHTFVPPDGQEQVRAAREAVLHEYALGGRDIERERALVDAFEAAVRLPLEDELGRLRAEVEYATDARVLDARRVAARAQVAAGAAERALLDKDKRIEQLEALIARAAYVMPIGQPETAEVRAVAESRHQRKLQAALAPRAALVEPPADDSPALCTHVDSFGRVCGKPENDDETHSMYSQGRIHRFMSPALCTCGHDLSVHMFSAGGRCYSCPFSPSPHPFEPAAGNDTPTQGEPANG